jgi:hypothetical protein
MSTLLSRRLLLTLGGMSILAVLAGLFWSTSEQPPSLIIPSLSGTPIISTTMPLAASVSSGDDYYVRDVGGIPLYFFPASAVKEGIEDMPSDAYVLVQMPDDVKGLTSTVFGGASAFKNGRSWFYKYTDDRRENDLVAQGKTGKEAWVGAFGISDGEHEASGGQHEALDTHGPDVVPGGLYFVSIDGSTNPEEFKVSSDSDLDFANDLEEAEAGTDPEDSDSDNDNIPDGVEIEDEDGDPLNADSDGDGIDDGTEHYESFEGDGWGPCEAEEIEGPFGLTAAMPVACRSDG